MNKKILVEGEAVVNLLFMLPTTQTELVLEKLKTSTFQVSPELNNEVASKRASLQEGIDPWQLRPFIKILVFYARHIKVFNEMSFNDKPNQNFDANSNS